MHMFWLCDVQSPLYESWIYVAEKKISTWETLIPQKKFLNMSPGLYNFDELTFELHCESHF